MKQVWKGRESDTVFGMGIVENVNATNPQNPTIYLRLDTGETKKIKFIHIKEEQKWKSPY